MSITTPVRELRQEGELLLQCLRSAIGTDGGVPLRSLLHADLDWTYLLRVAERHGVQPLFYWRLKATCPEAVPKAILERLQGQFYANACRSLILVRELLSLLELFEAHAIPVVPFKGPALAAATYGNPALRYYSDLDILVRQQDARRAKELVLEQGYQPTVSMTPWQERAYLHSGWDYSFDRTDPRIHLEIHWHFVPSYFSLPLDLGAMWARLDSTALAATPVRSLAPEDLLLMLCVHGGKHGWEKLKWIVDLAALVRVRPELHWQQVMELARQLGSERFLALGLFLAHTLLATTLPEAVWRWVQADSRVPLLAARVCDQLFCETDTPLGIFGRAWFVCRARERWQDRVCYCLRLALIPSLHDWTWVSLPPSLSFLYYLFRPLRLGTKYGPRFVVGRLR